MGCVGGKSPVYGTFSAAFSNWAGLKGYGFLYVQGSAVPYTINDVSLFGGIGSPFNTMTGIVWDKTGIKPVLNGTINLSGFTKGFTMQGLTITANSLNPAINIHNTTGTIKLVDVSVTNAGGNGISISNKGPVSLNLVNANGNSSYGAYIENAYFDGAKYGNTGNVTITNSAFLRNGISGNTFGFVIYSAGSILLNGVTAAGNTGDGADIYNYGTQPLIIRNSVFSNNKDAPETPNWGYGIYNANLNGNVYAITLDNVTLAGNGYDGAILRTGGNITLNKVYAVNNDRYGVYISGSYGTDTVGAKNVTVFNSSFISNQQNNLEIHASGAVKITNLYSTGSVAGLGLFVNNQFYTTIPVPVTVLGAVLSKNIGGSGGNIYSLGTVTLAGITALENKEYGMAVTNKLDIATGSIIVSGSLGLNRFNGNEGPAGLLASSYRNVALSSVQANGNGGGGVTIDGMGSSGNVTLVNVEASGNRGLGFNSVEINTWGAVLLNKVVVSDNAWRGISIDNDSAVYSRPVTVINSTASGNEKQGLYINSVGAITLSGVTASMNKLAGAELNNSVVLDPDVAPGITVSRSTFDQNGERGLSIYTLRKVTLTSINASENSTYGVYAYNYDSTKGSAIVVSGTNRINHNGRSGPYHGIRLESVGPVTVSGITAAWNPVDGVYVYTASSVTASNIQVIGNSFIGAEFYGNGLMTLTGITALQNGTNLNYSGVYVNNSTGKVRVNSGLILGNGAYGLWINVAGATEAERKMNYYIAPGVVVFGNDVKDPYEGLQIYIN